MNNVYAAEIDSGKNTSYVILPTTEPSNKMFSVFLMFLCYLVFIGYISLYDSPNIFNIRMFVDFLMDNQAPINNLSNEISSIVNKLPQKAQPPPPPTTSSSENTSIEIPWSSLLKKEEPPSMASSVSTSATNMMNSFSNKLPQILSTNDTSSSTTEIPWSSFLKKEEEDTPPSMASSASNMMNTFSNELPQISLPGSDESFVSGSRKSFSSKNVLLSWIVLLKMEFFHWFQNLESLIKMLFYRFMTKLYVKGNKIKISYKIKI